MKRTKAKRVIIKWAKIEATNKGRVIQLAFPYNLYDVNAIKAIKGAEWKKREKRWHVPLSLDNCFALREISFNFSDELKYWANAAYKKTKIKIKSVPGITGTPKKFQLEAVEMIERFNGRALIADEMGLGKTIEALLWLAYRKELRPAIILCPSFLKINWKRELDKWFIEKEEVIVLNGSKGEDLPKSDIYILNYHILPNQYMPLPGQNKKHKKEIPLTGWVDYLIKVEAKALIIDESHKIKEDTTMWTKAAFKLAARIPQKITMTGTPIDNKTREIYNSVHIVNQSIFPNKWKFLNRYCEPEKGYWGTTFDGSTNTEELHQILVEKVMIRRLKKDVAKELPKKSFKTVLFDIDNRTDYRRAKRNFKNYLRNVTESQLKLDLKEFFDMDIIEFKASKLERLKEENAKKATPAYQIEMLKQLAVQGKLKEIILWTENFLAKGKKLVLFFEHRAPMDIMYQKFHKKCVMINGSVSPTKRQEYVDKFQNDNKIRLFLGNEAAQEGLTLTAAWDIGIVEFPWKPGSLAQRIDRVHRLTTINPVTVYYLIAADTVDEYIAEILDDKMQTAKGVLDGKVIKEKKLISTLIEKIKYEED